uniref:Uncharacterized protein n=1 Tax=viral metagenome TaxID=1070528 RepID=A0A6C0BL50_9ZZZZ
MNLLPQEILLNITEYGQSPPNLSKEYLCQALRNIHPNMNLSSELLITSLLAMISKDHRTLLLQIHDMISQGKGLITFNDNSQDQVCIDHIYECFNEYHSLLKDRAEYEIFTSRVIIGIPNVTGKVLRRIYNVLVRMHNSTDTPEFISGILNDTVSDSMIDMNIASNITGYGDLVDRLLKLDPDYNLSRLLTIASRRMKESSICGLSSVHSLGIISISIVSMILGPRVIMIVPNDCDIAALSKFVKDKWDRDITTNKHNITWITFSSSYIGREVMSSLVRMSN